MPGVARGACQSRGSERLLRNLMIHEYDGVDYTLVWETVKNDLPPLIQLLEKRFRKG